MMKKTTLSDSQKNVLQLGHDKGTFTADDLPLKGAPRKKVLESLLNKQLIKIIKRNDQWQDYALTPEGRQAIGAEEPESKPLGKIRTGTKLHRVIELLSRPEGAAIFEIMRETGWQQHTVRGTLAGALKKRLGLTIDSEKPEGKDRIYRITAGLETL
ncbi:DUF3489 domain-containing protein [Endozoicomonas sp. Mp262]|uniref:DUF3489 domain-containing protein n=1 Tax=Endozoicomonas sp. Mp262 TaxID=2919499 RepID=UPI0021D9196C